MKIYLASDHGGFFLKEEIQKHLEKESGEVVDLGNLEYESGDDYPKFVIPLAEKVAKDWKNGEESLGVIIGRSGNGEVMAANKVRGIRAAIATNEKMAKMARLDNDANVLSLGADFVNLEMAKVIVDVFIQTGFSEKERHKRRVEMIKKYEDSKA